MQAEAVRKRALVVEDEPGSRSILRRSRPITASTVRSVTKVSSCHHLLEQRRPAVDDARAGGDQQQVELLSREFHVAAADLEPAALSIERETTRAVRPSAIRQ